MLTKLLLLSALVIAGTHAASTDAEWEDFKQRFGKTYVDDADEATHRAAYDANLDDMNAHNEEAEAATGDDDTSTHTMGVNEYSDMTEDEFNAALNGFIFDEDADLGGDDYEPDDDATPPTMMDWRKMGAVTPVKNQGKCGSCWAFSATGALEGQHFRKTKNLTSLSEQQFLDCDKMDHGCHGGMPQRAFLYVEQNEGVDKECKYPYHAMDGKMCLFKKEDVGATDVGFWEIPRGNEDFMMHAVAMGGPVSAAMDASHKSFHMYKSGIYMEKECNSMHLDHAVLVVGYGTENGMDYWLVKNSWGTSWGMEGYFMIARNKDNHCGIATASSLPIA